MNNLPNTLRADLILSGEIAEAFTRSVPSTYYAIALFLIDALLYRYWIMGVAEGDVEDDLLGQTQIIKMDCLAPRSPVGVMRRSFTGVVRVNESPLVGAAPTPSYLKLVLASLVRCQV